MKSLTPAEAERLALLAEECAEVIQAVTKILRHGYESFNPDRPELGNNRSHLERELGDVEAIQLMMLDYDDVCRANVDSARVDKEKKILRYLHHQVAKHDADRSAPHPSKEKL